ncbi:mRNA decapping complex subunit 2 [Ceratitis capitata]|uniref:mRNA decapping complex subunit 2 n=1 Tax=Ceratitis capitata TaxID=7213 RepID=UPI000329EFAD|nr:mRNA decapping complex subunit 2 [Ceratitis capitata]
MDVALNSVVASSTHTQQLAAVERYPTLLETKCNNSIYIKNYNIDNNGAVDLGQGILNLIGSAQECCKKEGVITPGDEYALASLSLKNALNLNKNVNEIDIQNLVEDEKCQQQKIFQCNSSGLALQAQQSENFATTSTELLSVLKGTTNIKNNFIHNTLSTSLDSSNLSTSPSSVTSSLTLATLSTSSITESSPVATRIPVASKNSAVKSVNGTKNGLQIPSDILDDLACRFIINVPDMELNNLIRICFQIELAHWFYLDFFCASGGDQQLQSEEGIKKKKLPSCGIKQFAIQIFQHISFLRDHLSSIDKILDDWKNYKLSVPTFGAILISEDLNFCLLVQSYFAKSSWGFPKGKVNENEDPAHCATREVYEETGYDITKLIVPNDYIEAVINYQYTRLYIVRGVSLDTQFSPRTRNEIKCCDWFPIDSLPVNKNDAISKAKLGINANSFFMIIPFVKRLKKWVNDKRSGIETRRKYTGGGGSSSPELNSPTTLMTTAAAAAAAAVGSNNQKNLNTSNSGKKNKHLDNYEDKHNTSSSSGGTTSDSGNYSAVSSGSKNGNNSNRSKRQRHKSMGDLDCNSNNNDKSSNNIKTVGSDCAESATESSPSDSAHSKTVSNHKRNGSSTKLSAASSINNGQHSNQSNVAGGNPSSKRQLFHSQSQSGNNQNGEKMISSFDLIRKEKQHHQKTVAQTDKSAKAQRQQQQQSNGNGSSGRVRAKSQGDKMCVQQQNTTKNNNTNNNNGGNNKHRVQKQISMIIANSNETNNKDNKSNTICNTAANKPRVVSTPLPSPTCSGAELLALAAEAVNMPPTVTNLTPRPRPASVSLHFTTSVASPAVQQLQRMASGTNLRILKRCTSYQPQTEQQELQTKTLSIKQLQEQQVLQLDNNQDTRQQPLKFTPSLNSWTNFSFTKNFISNVFC